MITLAVPRVLICAARHLKGPAWRMTVETICGRLYDQYGRELVFIHGGPPGGDTMCATWCDDHDFDEEHHRSHPVDWRRAKAELGKNWKRAGNDRNTHMLLTEQPRLIIGVHPWFHYATGGTSDMLLKGVLTGVPSWLVREPNPNRGEWVSVKPYLRVVDRNNQPYRVNTALASLVKAGWTPPSSLTDRLTALRY